MRRLLRDFCFRFHVNYCINLFVCALRRERGSAAKTKVLTGLYCAVLQVYFYVDGTLADSDKRSDVLRKPNMPNCSTFPANERTNPNGKVQNLDAESAEQ